MNGCAQQWKRIYTKSAIDIHLAPKDQHSQFAKYETNLNSDTADDPQREGTLKNGQEMLVIMMHRSTELFSECWWFRPQTMTQIAKGHPANAPNWDAEPHALPAGKVGTIEWNRRHLKSFHQTQEHIRSTQIDIQKHIHPNIQNNIYNCNILKSRPNNSVTCTSPQRHRSSMPKALASDRMT